MNASVIAAHFICLFSSYLSTQIPQELLRACYSKKEMAKQWHFIIQLVTPPKFKCRGNGPEFQMSLKNESLFSQIAELLQSYHFFFSCCFQSCQTGAKEETIPLQGKLDRAQNELQLLSETLSSFIAQYSFFINTTKLSHKGFPSLKHISQKHSCNQKNFTD